jgi:spermidine synthase
MRHVVLLIFFFSGLSALGLEIIWMRLFSLVFGGTSLAIGSWWGGLRADRLRRPLMFFGILELSIGLWGLLVPVWVQTIAPLHHTAASWLSPTALALLRFILATSILLVPTAMMGATLPILCRHWIKDRSRVSSDASSLYAVNTTGAVLGCLLTGFVFFPSMGVRHTLYLLAGIDIAVGLVALLFAKIIREGEQREVYQHSDRSSTSTVCINEDELAIEDQLPKRFSERDAVIVTYGITGILAMLCQVCWTRVLSMVIGSSVYAFTIILSAFLFGLALGAWFGSWLVRRIQNAVSWLAVLLVATGAAVWLSIALVDRLPLYFLYLAKIWPLTPTLLFGIKAVLSALLILIPTTAMGAIFPLVMRGYFRQSDPIGNTVGRAYALNTVGAIVGSFSSGFIAIPMLGIQGTLQTVVIVYLLLALMVFFLQENVPHLRMQSLLLIMAGIIAFGSLVVTPSWNRYRLGLGLFRVFQIDKLDPQKLSQAMPLLDYREGLHATVHVEQHGPHLIALKINGKIDASSGIDMPTQILSALLPLSLHSQTKDLLVIGWGSGVTVGTALHFPLRQLQAVEIESAVVKAARAFIPWNGDPERDPRLKLHIDDGRNFLARTRQKFDVIISEPSNPWMSGASALFTSEFFEMAKTRLRPQGMLCQWIQLYELSPENIRSLLATVASVFPHVYLFGIAHNNRDTLLIATQHPLKLSMEALDNLISDQRFRPAFLRAGMLKAIDLLPRILADDIAIRELVKNAMLNTDDNARIELTAPFDLLTHAESDGGAFLRQALGENYNRYQRMINRSFSSDKPCEQAEFMAELSLAQLRYGDIALAQHTLKTACPIPSSPDIILQTQRFHDILLGGLPDIERCFDTKHNTELGFLKCWNQYSSAPLSSTTLHQWLNLPAESPQQLLLTGLAMYSKRAWLDSLFSLAQLIEHNQFLRQYPMAYYLLGQLYRRHQVWPEAVWFTQLYLDHHVRQIKNIPN